MTYRTLRIDPTIAILPNTAALPHDAPGVLALYATGSQQMANSDSRRYYAALPPLRLLVVARNDIDLAALPPGTYVRALVGWDAGESPHTLPIHARQRHTKITIIALAASAAAAEPLSAIIALTPRYPL